MALVCLLFVAFVWCFFFFALASFQGKGTYSAAQMISGPGLDRSRKKPAIRSERSKPALF